MRGVRRGRFVALSIAVMGVTALLIGGMTTAQASDAAGEASAISPNVGCSVEQGDPGWQLSTSRFSNQFDAEPYVGNGHFSQRIPAAGMGLLNTGAVGWPLGTPRITSAIAAGLYARTDASKIYPNTDKQVIALIPTWSALTFSTPSGTYSPATATASTISGYQQIEDLRTGSVITSGIWTSPGGQRACFSYRIFTDRARKHAGVVSLRLTPLWTGEASVTSLLDGDGASWLSPVEAGVDLATHTSHVTSKTLGTGVAVSESATLRHDIRERVKDTTTGLDKPQTAGEQIGFPVRAGQTYTFTKYVSVVTGNDSAQPTTDALAGSQSAAQLGLPALALENRAAWDDVWKGDIAVRADPALQKTIRASEYNLFASIRSDSPMALGPTGLSGDGYAGMVFWDSDIWMFPALLATHPDLARVLVDYRYDTLEAAKHDATANGYQGAFYPWTAGADGYTGADCYGTVTDANDKIISDPNKSCSQELHLQADVALAQWEYYEATGDKQWLASHGWPVLQAVAEFWISKAVPVAEGGYAVNQVQPPDEAHTDVNNSAYTNAAAATALRYAAQAAQVLGKDVPASWNTVAEGLTKTMPFDPKQNVYLEYDGYDGAQIKQADTVMLTYPLGFPMAGGVGLSDLNYYAPRTFLGGPAMTDAIHSIDASALNVAGCSAYTYLLRSYQPFLRPPFDQLAETRSGDDTAFNFLTGIGGFMQVFQYGFSGLRFAEDSIRLDPSLAPQQHGVTLPDLKWQGRTFTVAIRPRTTTVTLRSGAPLPITTPGGKLTVSQGEGITIPTRRPDLQPTDDLARCQRVTASPSVAGDDPVAAVDGTAATPWIATEPHAWLAVQLSKPTDISSVDVTRGNSDPFRYTVEVSTDGNSWHTVATAPATSTGIDHFSFAPTTARFVRLSFPGGEGAKAPDITVLTVKRSTG